MSLQPSLHTHKILTLTEEQHLPTGLNWLVFSQTFTIILRRKVLTGTVSHEQTCSPDSVVGWQVHGASVVSRQHWPKDLRYLRLQGVGIWRRRRDHDPLCGDAQ